MDILGETIVYLVLNVIGGTIRWLIASLLSIVFNRKKYKFKDYLFENEIEDEDEFSKHGCLNTIIAILFIALVVTVITNFNK